MSKPTDNNHCKCILYLALMVSMACSAFGETYLRQQPKQPSSSTKNLKKSKFNWSIHDPHSGVKGTSEWTFLSGQNSNDNSPLYVSGTYAIPIDKHYQIQLRDSTCKNVIHDNNKVRIISTTEPSSSALKQSSSSIADHMNLQLLNVRVEMEDPSLFYFHEQQHEQVTDPKTTIKFCVRLDLMTASAPDGESVNFREAKFSLPVESAASSSHNNDTLEETTAEHDSCQQETVNASDRQQPQNSNTMPLLTQRSI
mmetsp:Transcript_20840/g.23358  ORF Transcript_20840/g.23358 Transcript_20840/m.23358 type:complete len:254 (+) Transcript_20840:51-812(+)